MGDAAVLLSRPLPLRAFHSNRDEMDGSTARRNIFRGSDHAPNLMNGDDMEEPGTRFPPARPLCSYDDLTDYDELTVFQSAPLVWRDENHALHPIDMLDFDRERKTLADSIEESANNFGKEISLKFETLTMYRLGKYLATSDTQVLHFSCHGSPGSLCVEDESGGTQRLDADGLRQIMSTKGGRVRFVFVSACFSRDVGQAFVDAGVPHVVCCQQDKPIMDVTAMEFTQRFYEALSSGETLNTSFELGKQAVEHSPYVPHERSADEARKYVLLPEGADHNVPVFYTKPRKHFTRSRSRSVGNLPRYVVPPPRTKIVGRELDLYQMIQSLKHQSLVKVTGPRGIGKRSAAKALCQYVLDRCLTFPFKEVVWLPLVPSQQRTNELLKSLGTVWKLVKNQAPSDEFCHGSDNEYSRACGMIIDLLHQRKALFVINAVEIQEAEAAKKLRIFLQDMFDGLGDRVQVILIVPPGLEGSFNVDCEEDEILLRPLGFRDTANLFGRRCAYVKGERCPKVKTEAELSHLLVPDGQEDIKADDRLSKRSADIFDLIGGGVPKQILTAAKQMTPEKYDELIRVGERKEPDAVYETRFALDQALAELHQKIAKASNVKNALLARKLQDEYDELEYSKEKLPDLSKLKEQHQSTIERENRAWSDKEFDSAHDLKKKRLQLEKQIKSEERAQSDAIKKRMREEHIWELARLMIDERRADETAEKMTDDKKDSQHATVLQPAAENNGEQEMGQMDKDLKLWGDNANMTANEKTSGEGETLVHSDAKEPLQSKGDSKPAAGDSKPAAPEAKQTAEQPKAATKDEAADDVKPVLKEMKRNPFSIVISQGSVLDFQPPNPSKAGIVNSTNEQCVGKNGVDGAIAKAGGPSLERDRMSLPVVGSKAGKEIRCPTGEAKITGREGASYGSLKVPFVIHAVGPRYKAVSSLEEGDRLLRKAYNESLERARQFKLDTVAFSLISAGVYREPQSLDNVLRIGLETIRDFSGYEELGEVHLFAFEPAQFDALVGVVDKLGLPKVNSKKKKRLGFLKSNSKKQLCLCTSDISDDKV